MIHLDPHLKRSVLSDALLRATEHLDVEASAAAIVGVEGGAGDRIRAGDLQFKAEPYPGRREVLSISICKYLMASVGADRNTYPAWLRRPCKSPRIMARPTTRSRQGSMADLFSDEPTVRRIEKVFVKRLVRAGTERAW